MIHEFYLCDVVFLPMTACRYLSGAKVGDVLRIKSECIKKGKTLAFATVDIMRKEDNKLVAIGRQTKYVNL